MDNKTARMEIRLTSQNYSVIEHAAALRGQSVPEFVVMASLKEAQRTIMENEVITLTTDDQQQFVNAMLNPKSPTPGLKRAIKAHRRLLEPT
ncbi:DUF1778 domain-containing protein [Planctomicrobium sp. SH668]|uniref:type II toxin-antitoxin system TacA family antitoxin n=1 Tax=Planctomicrobium sp. SH668 TaxID=3448126 RepID=UPI003F5B20DF